MTTNEATPLFTIVSEVTMLEMKSKITGLNYVPKFIFDLPIFTIDKLASSLKKSCFRLRIDENSILTISRWGFPKKN